MQLNHSRNHSWQNPSDTLGQEGFWIRRYPEHMVAYFAQENLLRHMVDT